MARISRRDVEAAKRQMNSQVSSRQIDKLCADLWNNETVECMATGQYEGSTKTGVLAVTTCRALFVYDDRKAPSTGGAFRLEQISSSEWTSRWPRGGTIVIRTGSGAVEIRNVNSRDGEVLVAKLNRLISTPPSRPQPAGSSDVLHQLSVLGQMLAAGQLTRAEYEALKARLLGG